MPEEPVRYKGKREKDFQYFTIEGVTVIAWKLPEEEKKDLKVKASIPKLDAEGGYISEQKSEWESFVHTPDFGLIPLAQWKKRIAQSISLETGSNVLPSNIKLRGTIEPESLARCPKCNNFLIVLSSGKCSFCGHQFMIR